MTNAQGPDNGYGVEDLPQELQDEIRDINAKNKLKPSGDMSKGCLYLIDVEKIGSIRGILNGDEYRAHPWGPSNTHKGRRLVFWLDGFIWKAQLSVDGRFKVSLSLRVSDKTDRESLLWDAPFTEADRVAWGNIANRLYEIKMKARHATQKYGLEILRNGGEHPKHQVIKEENKRREEKARAIHDGLFGQLMPCAVPANQGESGELN